MIYKCYICPECGSKRTRDLECELHGKDCPLIICCDCGAEVIDKNDIKKIEINKESGSSSPVFTVISMSI